MMPLAPHMSLPSIGHMTAATTSATTTSKPKLTFSIDSIVGRNSENNNKQTLDNNRLINTPPTAHQRPKHSPNCVQTSHRPLSPSNQMRNSSPLRTPSPILQNGPKSSPYLDHNRIRSHHQQQPHHHNHEIMTGGQPPGLSHPLMMGHHMSPLPQEYHHAVALYPWLLRANPFANRFHGMPFDGSFSSFLLPPFRKPKRIRTAFSPGQLLKLEQAFEKNHYVVGNERKQLANNLGLSETQVKVWFQNRRTKHKRQKQEEDEQQVGGVSNSSDNPSISAKNNDNRLVNCVNTDDEEDIDEDIDLEDDDLDSDVDNDVRHHVWYQSMPSTDMSQTSACIPSTSSSLKI